MEWYQLAHNPQAIVQLYTSAPSLRRVELMELVLHRDGSRLHLRGNLTQFPDKPPPRWLRDGVNTVHIQLDFWGLKSLQIVGWSTDNVVDIHIEKREDGQIALSTC